MEVKRNKANNQKTVTIPKENPLKDGDHVKVIKIEPMNLYDIAKYYKDNKYKFDEVYKRLIETGDLRNAGPSKQFVDDMKERLKIEVEIDEGIDYRLGNVWISCDDWYGNVGDSENYYPFDESMKNCDFERLLISEVCGDVEGFGFNKDKYDTENLKNSAILQWFIGLTKMEQIENDGIEKEIISKLGFKPYDWGGNCGKGEDSDIWFNEDLNIYLKLPIYMNSNTFFYTSLFTYDLAKEFEIKEFEINTKKKKNKK